jgi:hypothetical protein
MADDTLTPHPIQAIHIAPRELRIRAHTPPDLTFEYDETEFNLEVGHSDYFADQKKIQISTRVRMGTEDPELDAEGDVTGIPFFLFVEVVGIFEVDESKFPADRIYEWANANAMYIMYPYLREHVFALTSRAGFRPLLLELLEVPLFTLAKETTESSTSGTPFEPETKIEHKQDPV